MINFDINNGAVEPFTIVLSTRDYDHMGQISNVSNVKYTEQMNTVNELTFTIHKTKDGRVEKLWDDIYDLRLVYVKELKSYFEISVTITDQT